ncbi:MAG: hypothetical protein R3E64_06550 [Halioglobus sp.]
MNCLHAQLELEALLHITGPDSLKFLQGQTTCDTRKVSPTNAVPGAFCTPQGRVVCDFLLCELGPEHFALRMRRAIRASSSTAFAKYIVFSKAKLEAERDDWKIIAVWGNEAAATLREIFGEVPDTLYGVSRADNAVLVQTDKLGRQFECYLPDTSSDEIRARLAPASGAGSEASWQAQQIANGIARIEAATVGEFVPQTLNYDLTGHISFNKGCYTGQEVVARLHYRGKAKRRTYLFELNSETTCIAGAPLYTDGHEQPVGEIVNACYYVGKTHLLATSTANGLSTGLRLGAPDGPLLTLVPLPYSVAFE